MDHPDQSPVSTPTAGVRGLNRSLITRFPGVRDTLLGVISGMLLALGSFDGRWSPAQILVWALVASLLLAGRSVWSGAWLLFWVSGTFAGISLISTPLPWFMALVVLPAVMGPLVAWGAWAAPMARRRTVPSMIACACGLVVAEWVSSHLLPVFGTAQLIVRPWSTLAFAVQFAAWTGELGVVLVVGLIGGLLALVTVGTQRRAAAIMLLAVIGGCLVVDMRRWHDRDHGSLRVAALAVPCSWMEAVSGSDTWSAATAATRAGAEVIVGPEAQLLVASTSDELALHTRAAAFAHTWRCTLVLGYMREDGPARNRALVATPDGRIQVYDKTHLVLGRESGTHGSGVPTVVPIQAGQLGVMICQDDNFNDVADRYGDQGCSLMAVPTNDWPAVAQAHEQSGIWRAIEEGYAVIRSASVGPSVLIDPHGLCMARLPEPDGGPLVASLECGPLPHAPGWVRALVPAACAMVAGVLWWRLPPPPALPVDPRRDQRWVVRRNIREPLPAERSDPLLPGVNSTLSTSEQTPAPTHHPPAG